MKREEIEKLANKIAPSTQLSVIEIINIIDEIIDSQNSKTGVKFEIDEEYIQRVIWVKTMTAFLK